MSNRTWRFTACVLLLAGCRLGEEQRQKPVNLWGPSDVATKSRTVATSRWDTLWTFPTSRSSGSHTKPRIVAASVGHVYLFDDATHRVLAVNAAGLPSWEIPAASEPDLALGSAIDLKTASNGDLYILDAENSRILIVSPSGEIVARVPLPKSPRAFQIAPLADDRVLVLPVVGSKLTVFDRSGKFVRNLNLPWPAFENLNPLARQGVTVGNGDGVWVFAFGVGDGWFAFHGSQPLGYIGKYVEYRPFPEVSVRKEGNVTDMTFPEYAPCTACAVSLSDSSVFFLAGGSNQSMREVVDEFSIQTGAYLRSFRLPDAMTTIAITNGIYYGITKEEKPQLLALRPIL